jgi:hypothetical protein
MKGSETRRISWKRMRIIRAPELEDTHVTINVNYYLFEETEPQRRRVSVEVRVQ